MSAGVYLYMTLARPVLVALLAALASSTSTAQAERTRITTASSVRLRANPSDRSAIVAILPLGSNLVERATPARPLTETLDAQDRSWVHVSTDDGKTGWALAGLTRPTPAGQRFEVVDDLVRRRMIRPDDDFAARTELIDFIEREQTKASEPEHTARLALYRLQAIQRGLESLTGGHQAGLERLKSWPRLRQDLVVFNDPAAQWLLRHEAIFDEHAKHHDAIIADNLAWLAVTNGLPGECEGDTGCYLTRDNLLLGEYLRRHPHGAHVDSALTRIRKQASLYQGLVADPNFFKPSTDCGALTKPLTGLRAAVAATSASGRDRALEALDDLGHRCSGD